MLTKWAQNVVVRENRVVRADKILCSGKFIFENCFVKFKFDCSSVVS